MPESTEQVAAPPAPTVPASAAALQHDVLTPKEAETLAQQAAARTRKSVEAEWQQKLDAEVATREAELKKYRDAEKARTDAELDELTRTKNEREALAEQARVEAQRSQSLEEQLAGAQKRNQVSMMIAASKERVPSRYHADVYAELAQADEVTQDRVDAALGQARAAWDADNATYGQPPPPPPPARHIGSATAPPSSQPVTEQTPEERAAYIKDITLKAQRGDKEAGKALDLLYGQRNPVV